MNSNKFEKYCQKAVDVFKNDKSASTAFSKAAKALDSVLGGNYERDKAKDAALFSTTVASLPKAWGTDIAETIS